MDIMEKATELGKMIRNSKEMQDLNTSEERVGQDQKAGTLLNDYKLLQIEMVRAAKENRDKEVVESIKSRLMAKQEEINNYEITNNYLQAKVKLEKLMKTINDVMIYAITGEEPCSPSKCGSCGGGCK